MTVPSLSLMVLVRDEEQYLPRCLESVKGVVGEIVVVDTGSRDKTAEVARSYGAHVITFDWQRDFAEAHNFALAKTTGRWVLRLDADEALAPAARGALARLATPWYEVDILVAYFARYMRFTDAVHTPLLARHDFGRIALFP